MGIGTGPDRFLLQPKKPRPSTFRPPFEVAPRRGKRENPLLLLQLPPPGTQLPACPAPQLERPGTDLQATG
jgi:hypothetical protein